MIHIDNTYNNEENSYTEELILSTGRKVNVTWNAIYTDRPTKQIFQPYIDKVLDEINS